MRELEKLYGILGPWFWLIVPAGGISWGWCVGLGKKYGESFAQEFGKYFGKTAAEWIHDRSAPFKIRYLTYLSDLVRHVDIKGFAQDTPFALELMDVFVDLSLDPQSLRNIPSGAIRPLPEALATGRHSVWEYLEEPGQRLAVIGAPGSGKTTLLKHMVLAGCARKKSTPHKIPRSLPVFIEIRKHAKAIGDDPGHGLADAALVQLGAFGKRASKSWFDSHLDRGGCLVLLDGLDEVADAQLRQTVVNWVEKQISAYPKNRYVVTSRPNGYRNNPIQGFNTLEVQSFTQEDIRRFVHDWYLANEVAHHNGARTPAVRIKAEEGARGLLGKLRQSADLSELASNPLLLTMIATIHRFRGSLPGSRVELYQDIASVFLGRRRQARELDFDLSPEQKKSVLEPLAYYMMLRRIKEIPQEEACSIIQEPIAAVRPNTSAFEFLRQLESTSGLFAERENGVWGFAHLTIQEYLAAVHIKSRGLGARLVECVHDSWWNETVRLYVAQTDATDIIEACLARNPAATESLVLAIQCLEEAKTVSAESRGRFQELISHSVESPDSEMFRPIAEALLHLRIAKMESLDENRFLSDYFTHAEYQLFLDELRAKGEYRQPDHWGTYGFPIGTGSNAVAGVRASDAKAFAEWLAERSAVGFKFRLPQAENEIPPEASEESTGFWVRTAKGEEISGASARSGGISRSVVQYGNVVIALGFNKDLDLDLGLAQALGVHLNFSRNYTLGRSLIPDLASDPSLDLDLALKFALDRNLNLNLVRAVHDFARVADLARDLHVTYINDLDHALRELAERDRSFLERRTSGRYQTPLVLLFLDKYSQLMALRLYFAAVEVYFASEPGVLGRFNQPETTKELRTRLATFRDQCFSIYFACRLDQLQREGKIPILGGIRLVRERLPDPNTTFQIQ